MVQTLEKSKLHKPLWILYGCPRCHYGELYLDYEDDHYHCLQCGYIDWEFEVLSSAREYTTQIGGQDDNESSNHDGNNGHKGIS